MNLSDDERDLARLVYEWQRVDTLLRDGVKDTTVYTTGGSDPNATPFIVLCAMKEVLLPQYRYRQELVDEIAQLMESIRQKERVANHTDATP